MNSFPYSDPVCESFPTARYSVHLRWWRADSFYVADEAYGRVHSAAEDIDSDSEANARRSRMPGADIVSVAHSATVPSAIDLGTLTDFRDTFGML